MRQFIRHPVNIPIEVCVIGHIPMEETTHASDLGTGGLVFRSQKNIEPGTFVNIKIPYFQPAFETEAKIVWCRKHHHGAELGVEFLNVDDAFKARMVEQACQIENYKHSVRRKEGRDLTTQEAAAEWIGKYAAKFQN